MSAQIIFSADDQAALIKLNSEGWSLRRLAARFGVSHMTIKRLLRRRFPYFNLYRGDIVQIADLANKSALVVIDRIPGRCLDVPLDALTVSNNNDAIEINSRWTATLNSKALRRFLI